MLTCKRLLTVLSPIPLLVASSVAAHANTLLIDADNSHGALCNAISPCGSVTVTGTSTLTVTITMNTPFGVFGNNDTFGFNVKGPTSGVTITDFSNPNFNGNGGSGNEDGWGSFMFRVDGPGGSGAVSTLSFEVTRSGTPFTGPSDIETGATGGNGFTVFGLHVRNDNSGLTGYAGTTMTTDPTDPTAPEPASLGILGTVMFAGLLLKRRFTSARLKSAEHGRG